MCCGADVNVKLVVQVAWAATCVPLQVRVVLHRRAAWERTESPEHTSESSLLTNLVASAGLSLERLRPVAEVW